MRHYVLILTLAFTLSACGGESTADRFAEMAGLGNDQPDVVQREYDSDLHNAGVWFDHGRYVVDARSAIVLLRQGHDNLYAGVTGGFDNTEVAEVATSHVMDLYRAQQFSRFENAVPPPESRDLNDLILHAYTVCVTAFNIVASVAAHDDHEGLANSITDLNNCSNAVSHVEDIVW